MFLFSLYLKSIESLNNGNLGFQVHLLTYPTKRVCIKLYTFSEYDDPHQNSITYHNIQIDPDLIVQDIEIFLYEYYEDKLSVSEYERLINSLTKLLEVYEPVLTLKFC